MLSVFNQYNAVVLCEVLGYVPLASTLVSLENSVRKVFQKDTLAIHNDEAVYDNYVRFKSNYRIALGLIPVFGNLILFINDLANRTLGHTSRMEYSNYLTLWEARVYAYKSSEYLTDARDIILNKQKKLRDNQYTFAQGKSTYYDSISGRESHYYNLLITSKNIYQIKTDYNNKILLYPYSYIPGDEYTRGVGLYQYKSFKQLFTDKGLTNPELVKWE